MGEEQGPGYRNQDGRSGRASWGWRCFWEASELGRDLPQCGTEGPKQKLCFLGPRADVQDASLLPSSASAKVSVAPALCCPLAQWPFLAQGETEAQGAAQA